MPQYINVGIHDMVDDESQQRAIAVEMGNAEGIPQYDIVRLGYQADIFIRRARLVELRDAIANYIDANSCPKCETAQKGQALCEECRTEQAIEDRDDRETGADRCPPRE